MVNRLYPSQHLATPSERSERGYSGASMAQSKVKHKTAFPGVRYREHPTRKHGAVNKDRYYTIRYKVDGKDKEEGVGWASEGKTPEKAYDILKLIKDNIRNGTGPQSYEELRAENRASDIRKKERAEEEEKRRISFGTFFEETYMPQAESYKRDNTIHSERCYYNKWISPIFKDIALINVNRFYLDKMLLNMTNEGCAKRTKNYALSVISQVWNLAKKYKIVSGDCPTKECVIKYLDNERTRFLSEEEARIILDELKKRDKDLHDIALMSLLCGMREGEILNLKWSDIDMSEKRIQILNTKSYKTRHAWFGPEIEEFLKERLANAESKEDLIFPPKNHKMHYYVSKTFKNVVDKLGFNDNITDNKKKLVFHSLRHTFASWLAKRGVSEYIMMKLMGHSSFKMLQRYAHLTNTTLKEKAGLLHNIFNQSNKEKQ